MKIRSTSWLLTAEKQSKFHFKNLISISLIVKLGKPLNCR